VQLAKLGGARAVLATVSRDEQASRAREAGADYIINYKSENVAERAKAILGGGVDRVVEVALGKNLAADATILAVNGVIAAYSSDEVPEPVVPFNAMLMKDLTIRFVLIYEIGDAARLDAAREINRLLTTRRLKHQIAEIYSLEQAAMAHARMEEGCAIGKLLLRVARV
jgi:NADPH2:quinone reductase